MYKLFKNILSIFRVKIISIYLSIYLNVYMNSYACIHACIYTVLEICVDVMFKKHSNNTHTQIHTPL